jgi:hypothetical protein
VIKTKSLGSNGIRASTKVTSFRRIRDQFLDRVISWPDFMYLLLGTEFRITKIPFSRNRRVKTKKTSVNKKMEEELIHIASNIHHYITSVNFIHMCKKSFKKLNKNKISVTNNSPQTMERMNMPNKYDYLPLQVYPFIIVKTFPKAINLS